MNLLTVNSLSKSINGNLVADNISFSQKPLQKIAIAGETGSGKTTLLRMIAGWIQPDGGELKYYDEKIIGPNDQLIAGRKEIAYLSQHFELRNNYWVHEIMEYANELSAEDAEQLYRVCRINHLLTRRTDQLSGGEKQRVALARLLSTSPGLLLMDEPFSNLDRINKEIIKTVLNDITTELNISCILVSHDAADLLSWADSLILMKEGRFVQMDSPATIYWKPVNEYCAGLLGDYNLFRAGSSNPLLKISGVEASVNDIMVRPESIQITSNNNGGWKGLVHSIAFWGSYFMLLVEINKELIKVKTSSSQFHKDDIVYLSIDSESAWSF